MDREIEIDVAANAMAEAAELAGRTELTFSVCRVLARVALDALDQARAVTAGA